jgi:hypothetical protein
LIHSRSIETWNSGHGAIAGQLFQQDWGQVLNYEFDENF